MSEKIRIGNDIDIRWTIVDSEGAPYVMTGRDISIELNVGTKKVRIREFDVVDDNTLHFIYYGKDQRYLGSYALKFIENDGEVQMVTFDTKDAFTLVEHSWQANVDPGELEDRVYLEYTTVTSELMEKIGPPGPAAGFGEVTASVDDTVGTPSVEVEASGPNTAKNFNFIFHNLKGEEGNPGDAAGFGQVSATVDAAVGTPSVEVSSSGPDTAKNFVFAFHNLKGDKGDTGDAAGFGQVSASVDANVGTPSVEVSASGPDTAKVFSFAFHNIKGNKGDTGDAAGFGQATASVDANVGTPSVEISASGPNTAKVFAFAFHNLKGDKGDTGNAAGFGNVSATVDANVGTPSVEVTASGPDTAKVFAFAFHNMKGAKGDTGDAAGFGQVSATVDANIGTPSVEVSASGPATAKVFTFTFHNLKGEKGDPGGAVWGQILGTLADQPDLKNALDAKYEKPSGGIPATDIASGVIPDVSNFITKSVDDLVNYYLKSDTYTKTEVQNLINAVKQFTYEVVSTLPSASADTMHKIYLVPSADPQTQNVKDEYITLDGGSGASPRYTWEQIGSTAIDLTGYVTTQDLNTALASYTTTADLNTLLAGKADAATTLAGYGITDAKIENGVITLGSNTITPLTQHQDISGKADKVSGAVTGNFASLDSNGNLEDSGKKPSDFMVEAELTSQILTSIWEAAV